MRSRFRPITGPGKPQNGLPGPGFLRVRRFICKRYPKSALRSRSRPTRHPNPLPRLGPPRAGAGGHEAAAQGLADGHSVTEARRLAAAWGDGEGDLGCRGEDNVDVPGVGGTRRQARESLRERECPGDAPEAGATGGRRSAHPSGGRRTWKRSSRAPTSVAGASCPPGNLGCAPAQYRRERRARPGVPSFSGGPSPRSVLYTHSISAAAAWRAAAARGGTESRDSSRAHWTFV